MPGRRDDNDDNVDSNKHVCKRKYDWMICRTNKSADDWTGMYYYGNMIGRLVYWYSKVLVYQYFYWYTNKC